MPTADKSKIAIATPATATATAATETAPAAPRAAKQAAAKTANATPPKKQAAARKSAVAPAAAAAAPPAAPAAVSTVKPAKPPKDAKPPKADKLVRDSFTIPRSEYTLLHDLKLRAARLGQPAKKSEVLRAGIQALQGLDDAALLAVLASVPVIKTGRPSKD